MSSLGPPASILQSAELSSRQLSGCFLTRQKSQQHALQLGPGQGSRSDSHGSKVQAGEEAAAEEEAEEAADR